MDIITARAMRRKTQWDIKRETGISQTKLSLIERGYVHPSDNEKKVLANALGFKSEEISWEASPK